MYFVLFVTILCEYVLFCKILLPCTMKNVESIKCFIKKCIKFLFLTEGAIFIFQRLYIWDCDWVSHS